MTKTLLGYAGLLAVGILASAALASYVGLFVGLAVRVGRWAAHG